jgi:hypothetical protein
MATVGCGLHDAPKQLPLEGVNPNVIVRDVSRINQAANHNSSTIETAAHVLLLADKCGHGLPAKRFHSRNQLVELRTWLSRRPGGGVVGLPPMRIGGVTQLNPPAGHHSGRVARTVDDNRRRPTRLDRKAER